MGVGTLEGTEGVHALSPDTEVSPRPPEEQFQFQSQQQVQQEVIPAPTPGGSQTLIPTPPTPFQPWKWGGRGQD